MALLKEQLWRGEKEREKEDFFFQLPLVGERNETLQEIKTQDQQSTKLATNLKLWSSGMASAQSFIAGEVCGGYF